MKALIQRVMNASVSVNGDVISSIDQGICAFIGICEGDTSEDAEQIAQKLLTMKLFDHENRRWSKNVVEKQLELLCVSQFTLYGIWQGTKPDFHHAKHREEAQMLYEEFLDILKGGYRHNKIKDGLFGSHMQVSVQNDGPVTFMIESTPTYEQRRPPTPPHHLRRHRFEMEPDPTSRGN